MPCLTLYIVIARVWDISLFNLFVSVWYSVWDMSLFFNMFVGVWYSTRVTHDGSTVSLVLDDIVTTTTDTRASSYSLLDVTDTVYLGKSS